MKMSYCEQRVAARLEHTNALLDKYMRILSRSEKITKLMLDETWQGADAVCTLVSVSYML